MQTDCKNIKLMPYAQKLDISPNFNQEIHFSKPLSKLFDRVIRFDVGEAYIETGVTQANRRIIELVKEHSPKYVIWPMMTYEVLEETFHEIRGLGAYVIGWFFDDESRFDNYSRWWIPYLDYIFTVDKTSVLRYQQLGAMAYHLLVTGEPEDFKPSTVNSSYEVSFVGSRRVADRDNLVQELIMDGVSISVFGNGWNNGFVSDDEMVQIFSTSKINICFTKSSPGRRNQLKGKIFDITMCGGFLLCEHVDGIEEIFEIGKEIVCFSNYSDALEKINYFLANDIERERIAKSGKIRATRDLAQHKLLEKVFNTIELDINKNKGQTLVPASSLQMPLHIRIAHSKYHLRWATVLKKVGFEKKYWKDEIKLANKYISVFTRMKLNYSCIASIAASVSRAKKRLK